MKALKSLIKTTGIFLVLFMIAGASSSSAFLQFLPPVEKRPIEIYRKGHSCVWPKMPNRVFFYSNTTGRPDSVVIGGRSSLERIRNYEWRVSQRFSDKRIRQMLHARQPLRMLVTAENNKYAVTRVVLFRPVECGL